MNARMLCPVLLSAALLCLLTAVPVQAFELDLGFGSVSTDDVAQVFDSADTIISGTEFTPEQEHYLGRSVAANIFDRYQARNDLALNVYVNQLGQTLAAFSDRPETFGGYHFQVLDSDEINAFATPGGFIFVTTGLLRCCAGEDALAAVLSHEISHVVLAHGVNAIEASRTTQAATTLATIGAKAMTSGQVAELTDLFADSLADITNTLIVNGYSKDQEYEADAMAVALMQRVGYDPHAMTAMLETMAQRLDPDGKDFAHTHPSPEDRLEELRPLVDGQATAEADQARQTRFDVALAGI